MKSDATKQALQLSVTALILCVATLVGATFAWFTDVAPVSVGKIQAAEFKVVLSWTDAIKDSNNATLSNIVWHNVKTAGYENSKIFNITDLNSSSGTIYKYLKIENTGSSSVNYYFKFLASSLTEGVADKIDVYYASASTVGALVALSEPLETTADNNAAAANGTGSETASWEKVGKLSDIVEVTSETANDGSDSKTENVEKKKFGVGELAAMTGTTVDTKYAVIALKVGTDLCATNTTIGDNFILSLKATQKTGDTNA